MANSSIEPVDWSDVKPFVLGAVRDRRLADVLDEMHKKLGGRRKAPQLYLAEYPYGAPIVEHGQFCVPETGALRLRSQLTKHTTIPLCLVLAKQVEVFLPSKPGVPTSTLRLVGPGEFIGTWEVWEYLLEEIPSSSSEKPANWWIVSGARAVHVIAPTGSKEFVRYMERRGVADPDIYEALKSGADTWTFLRLIAGEAAETWKSKLLIFPAEWLRAAQEFHSLFKLIGKAAWQQSADRRDAPLVDSAAEYAVRTAASISLGNKDLLRHLRCLKDILSIGRGDAIAFGIARPDCDQSGPFKKCADYLSTARGWPKAFQQYVPIILEPVYLTASESTGLYSLSLLHLGARSKAKDDHTVRWAERLHELGSLIKRIHPSKEMPVEYRRIYDTIEWPKVRVISSTGSGLRESGSRSREEDRKRREVDRKELEAFLVSGQIQPKSDPAGYVIRGEPTGDHATSLLSGARDAEVANRVYLDHPFFKACVKVVRK